MIWCGKGQKFFTCHQNEYKIMLFNRHCCYYDDEELIRHRYTKYMLKKICYNFY